jgi:hypothetical protein
MKLLHFLSQILYKQNYRPVLSSERAPYIKKKESNYQTKKIEIWSGALKGADTKTI